MSARNVSAAPRPRLAPLPISRWTAWFVFLAALLLIAASLGSYLHHRRQLDSIAAQHLRLTVVGPGELHCGAPLSFNLHATRVTGEPWPVSVEWSLSTPDVDRTERTDDQGRLVMTVPAKKALPVHAGATARLSVSVGDSNNLGSATLLLPIRPAQYRTFLDLDRESYRPGETVYYRSLTLGHYGLADGGTLPLEYEIVDGKGAPLPESQWIGLTEQGVGNGSYRLPPSLAPGAYALVARGGDAGIAEKRLSFEVKAARASRAPDEKLAADKSSARKSARVDFFPEGGTLAAGLENRVYFSVSDDRGRPLRIRGKLVNGKGESMTALETLADGRGAFRFVPDAAGSYSMKITEPAGLGDSFPLPPASSDQKVAIEAVRGVLAADQPLELAIRAAKANIPLVVTASAHGISLGQQLLITPANAAKGIPVAVPLDERAAGIICATVYDASQCPLQTIARRLVFRRPRRLVVRAAASADPARDLLLSVENEKGEPVAAALSLKVVRGGKATASAGLRSPRSLLSSLLADAGLPNLSALEDLDFHSPPAIDLALGCQNLSGAGNSHRGAGVPHASNAAETTAPPLVFDNLAALRNRYETTLSDYRAQRTHVVNALIMLSFFGGLALALLVTMLAILRIVWGSQLWLPTIIAMVCCAVVTSVSNDPSRMQPIDVAAVGFAVCSPAPPNDAASSPPPVENQLRRLAERLAQYSSDAKELPKELQADRFPPQQYVQHDATAESAESAGKPVAWYPLLVAGLDGRVAVPGLAASAAKGLRLIVDAHGDGRVESCELTIK